MRKQWISALAVAGAVLLVGCQNAPSPRGAGGGGGGMMGGGFEEGGMEGVGVSVGVRGGGGLAGVGAGGTAVMPRENDGALDVNDPCVNNLENLTGALLAYYAVKHRLPEKLEEVVKLGGAGGAGGESIFGGDEKISLVCPKSGKAYAYVAEGMRAPAALAPKALRANGTPQPGNLLILYDAEAVHEVVQRLTDGEKNWDVKKVVRYGIVMVPPEMNRPVKMYVIPVEQALLDMYVREGKRQRTMTQVGGTE